MATTLADTLAAAKAAAQKRLAEIEQQLAKLRAEESALVKERRDIEKSLSGRKVS